MYMDLRERGESLADRFLDEKEYAACGGGFPIRVEEVGVIGTIAITGLDHVSEHVSANICMWQRYRGFAQCRKTGKFCRINRNIM